MATGTPVPATDGNIYIPPAERTGNESIVYFTRDLSAGGLRKAYAKVNGQISGNVAVKLHTGEKDGPNIIPHTWVEELMGNELAGATIVETNTYYEGDRDSTEKHRETIAHNGWTFAPVDIMDEDGATDLPVLGGRWFETIGVGTHMLDYHALVALTHFKGHTMGGFGGSNKNIGIGCADAVIGKAQIHRSADGAQWGVTQEELMERMTESTKATIDFFGKHTAYVNVMRNMSVSCDCEGLQAQPVVTPNLGILSSTDILALDQACVDLVFAMTDAGLVGNRDLVDRMITRHGMRQLTYMRELGMGNWNYILIDLDNGGARLSLADAVAHAVPFEG